MFLNVITVLGMIGACCGMCWAYNNKQARTQMMWSTLLIMLTVILFRA